MEKLDLRSELKHLYKPSAKNPAIIEVPPMKYFMIDGEGDPNTSSSFQDAIETLYGASYTLKFLIKKTRAIDYTVMALEGLWWVPDMREFSVKDKGSWLWTLMIMQPDLAGDDDINAALAELEKKKNPPALSKLQLETFNEGLSAQIMYIGPFADEGPTVKNLHDFIKENGYRVNGKHHEVYLSDFRKTAPERLKTVIRQPIKKA